MHLTTVIDATGANIDHLVIPPGAIAAGYVTGTGPVPWTPAQLDSHPGAIRIDQWPLRTDAGRTADWIDVENGAVPINQVPSRVKAAQIAYKAGERPGQRWPAVYVEQSEVTPVVNALIAAGLTDNVPLILTEPMSEQEAVTELQNAGGPFPIVGIQYQFNGDHDVSLVSTAWLSNVTPPPEIPMPAANYTVQVERYQDGFGWVLATTINTPPATRYRIRISNGQWSNWTEINP